MAVIVFSWLPAKAATSVATVHLSPDTAEAGGSTFTLTIHGSGFTVDSTAEWDGTILATNWIDAKTLTAAIPASLIARAGAARVTVLAARGESAEAQFTISPAIAADGGPAVAAPAAAIADSASVAQVAGSTTPSDSVFLPNDLLAPSVARLTPAPTVAQAGALPAGSSSAETVPAQVSLSTAVSSAASSPAASSSAVRSSGATSNAVGVTVLRSAGGSSSTTTTAPGTTLNPPSTTSGGGFVGAVWLSSAATLDLPPTITSITPNTVVADSPTVTLVVNGTNFLPGASGTVVELNYQALTTTYVSSTQVTAIIPSSKIGGSGCTDTIVVVTSNGYSSGVPFVLTPPVPVINSLSLGTLPAGSPSFVLDIYGPNYPASATLNWGSTQLQTTGGGSGYLTVNVPASLLATVGNFSLTLTTAGGTSAPVNFTVQPASPVIASLSTYSVPAGSQTFTLTINGTGFVVGSFASLGSPRLYTSYVSPTELTANVPASLLASAYQAGIAVYSPGGGGWSKAVYFTVSPVPPVITSLSPASVKANGAGFSLIVTGAAFSTDSIVNWGAIPLGTTYVSATELIASVPSNLMQTYGNVSITVTNSLGSSAPSTLPVNPTSPSVTSFSPYVATAGMPTFTITFTGQDFIPGTIAKWGSTALATTVVSQTELTATVPANLVAGTGTATISLTSSVGTSPLYTVIINPPIAITTTTVPSATAGTNYSAPVTVTGGSPGYNWNVTGLPASMTFSTTFDSTLTISGTPASAGPITFQVTATDQAGAVAGPVSYTINVAAGPNSVNNASLNGTYVCMFQGLYDLDGTRWASVGSFQADGQGNFSGGVFDTNSYDIGTGSGLMSGTYSIGADNNGLASIHTALKENIAGNQTTQWSIALTGSAQPAQQFRMVESDDLGTLPSGQQGTANCYLATPSAFAAGTIAGHSFVFGLEGEDNAGVLKETAGLFSATAANTASGVVDLAQSGSAAVQTNGLTATYTTPDPTTGRFTMNLNGDGASTGFTVYIIDSNRMFVLDNTNYDGEQAGNIRTQQQSSYSAASLDGPFVLYNRGAEFNGSSSSTPSGFYANVFEGSGDGAGNLTIHQSYTDDDGTYTAGSAIGEPTALVFDAANSGRATLQTAGGTTYLYFFDTDSAIAMSVESNGSLDSGWMEAQTQTTFTDAALAGNDLYGELPLLTATADGSVGELSLTSDGDLSGGLSTAGEKSFFWDQAASGTYSWDATASGTGTFQIAGAQGAASCAVVSATRSVCIPQTDPEPSVEILQQ